MTMTTADVAPDDEGMGPGADRPKRRTFTGVRRVVRANRKRNVPCSTKGQFFRITADGEDVSGLTFREGDEYRVLECDGDAVLVEAIGNADNPYFVSSTFLGSWRDTEGEP